MRPPEPRSQSVERVTRIELALSAWEADVLPLNYTRAEEHEDTGPRCEPGTRPDIVPESAGREDRPQGIYLLPMSGQAARPRRPTALRASPAPDMSTGIQAAARGPHPPGSVMNVINEVRGDQPIVGSGPRMSCQSPAASSSSVRTLRWRGGEAAVPCVAAAGDAVPTPDHRFTFPLQWGSI